MTEHDTFVETPPDRAAQTRIADLAGDPPALAARLGEIELEWSIERVVEANAYATSLIGTGIGLARKRGLMRLNLPVAVLAFVLQHAVRGARPPEALLRRWGFRSEAEIERERLALHALAGTPPERVGARTGPRIGHGVGHALARQGRRLLRRRPPGGA